MTEVNGLTLGVDLGGTKVLTALVDGEGQILASHRRATDVRRGATAVIDDVVACVRGCLGDASRCAVALGIGVAGQVDTASGTVSFAPNLGWRDVSFGDMLTAALDMPVAVANDVRAAATGEWRYGVAKGARDLVALFVGTGVGGAVVTAGRMLEGRSNAAGELGHMTVVTHGRKCHCPNFGCLEAYASGWAIAERAREAARSDPDSADALVGFAGAVDDITAAHVTEAYRSGDALTARLVIETGDYLAAAGVALVNVFNPEVLVLGGGVIEALPELVSLIDEGVAKWALPAARDAVTVQKAALAGDAGVVGAAALARHHYESAG